LPVANRVTRLGGFAPVGICWLWAVFENSRNTYVDRLLGSSSHADIYICIKINTNVLGYNLSVYVLSSTLSRTGRQLSAWQFNICSCVSTVMGKRFICMFFHSRTTKQQQSNKNLQLLSLQGFDFSVRYMEVKCKITYPCTYVARTHTYEK
jgi:hypothetical protein